MRPTRQALGESRHFAHVYAEHLGAVIRAALDVVQDRPLAEDVAQDVFLDLWRRPDRYDPSRGELLPYLRLRARSRALDLLRTRAARVRLEDRLAHAAAGDAATAPDVATRAAERDGWSALAVTLGGLPGEQRDAVALAHLAGLTALEIAAARKIPVGTAKSRVRLGLEKLRVGLAPAT